MKGFGSYNDWSYYASPSSNLSAFATPFSVNRTSPMDVSAPFIDPGDAARPGFPYRYPDQYYGTKPDLVEPQQYFNSYGVLQDHNSLSIVPDHWSSFSGFTASDGGSRADYVNKPNELGFAGQSVANQVVDFGNGKGNQIGVGASKPNELGFGGQTVTNQFADVGNGKANQIGVGYNKPNELGFAVQTVANQFADFGNGKGNQIGVGGGFALNQTNFTGSAADERMKSGCQDVTNSHGEGPHMIGLEKHSLATSADHVDDKPFWWRTTKLANAGCRDITDSHGEVPHMTGWEKHSLPTNGGCVDDKSCWWRPTKPMPVDFSHTSVLQSPPLSLETHHEAPLKLAVDSGDHHFSYTGVYDKHLGQQDKLTRVDTVSSTSIAGSVTDLNLGIFVPDGGFGHKKFSDIKEAAASFGLNLRMNLDRNEASSSNNAMISDMNDSGDVVDYKDKARHEFQYLQPNPGLLSLGLNAIQGGNSVEKSFECVGDLCNPSVDSPCWKGAPSGHFSYYESSEALPPEKVPKNEFKMNDNSVPPTKPIGCESGSSQDDDQVTVENKLVPQKLHTLCISGADARCNENICSAFGTSLTGEHALSLSSVEDAPTTPEKSARKLSTEELNAQMLVDTMNKYSQSLLNHCLNDACALEEQNCSILRDVITNLNTCVLSKSTWLKNVFSIS